MESKPIPSRIQTSLLELLVARGISTRERLAAMARLSPALYERSPEAWREWEALRLELDRHFSHLEYEGELQQQSPMRAALELLDEHPYGRYRGLARRHPRRSGRRPCGDARGIPRRPLSADDGDDGAGSSS